MGFGSYSFLVGPMIALLAIIGLMGVSRWMSGQSSSLIEQPVRPGSAEEYGLMIPVASPRTRAGADRLVSRLTDAGIRSQVVDTTEGPRVMVWAEEVSRAREILDAPR